jgi:hypothetical protein
MKIKHTLLAGTAAIALAAGINIAIAQAPSSGGGAEKLQGQGTSNERGGVRGEPRGQEQGQRDKATGQDTRGDGQKRDTQRGQAQPQQGEPRQKDGQRDSADDKRSKQDRGTTADQRREGREREKATDQRQEGKRDRESTGAASATVTTQQTTRIREHRSALTRGRVDRSRINFNISVGTTIPRTVTFYELPPAIIEVVPAWRGYRYILVEDEIVIIDPTTYRIVAVIDA